MINYARDQIEEKITQCGDALTDLKRHQKEGTVDYLRAHPDTYFAVCYRFIGAIESLFDIAQYVLSDRGARAKGQGDIPVLLSRERIISDDMAKRLERMYGFRNRLVHAYGTLDDAKVAEYLAEHLPAIEDVLAVFSGRKSTS